MQNIINLFEITFLVMYNCVLNVCWFSHICPFNPSSPCFGFFLVDQLFKDLVQAVSDSNLNFFFYDAVCDVASIINYSKKPLDAIAVDSPPTQEMFLLMLSPLKGATHARDCGWDSPSRFGGNMAPRQWLWMDLQPTLDAPILFHPIAH